MSAGLNGRCARVSLLEVEVRGLQRRESNVLDPLHQVRQRSEGGATSSTALSPLVLGRNGLEIGASAMISAHVSLFHCEE